MVIAVLQSTHDPLLQDTRTRTIITYAGIGAGWNLGNVSFKKIQLGEKMVWRKLARAVLIGAVAGIGVAMQGGEPSPGNLEIAASAAVPLVDKILNKYENGPERLPSGQSGNQQTQIQH